MSLWARLGILLYLIALAVNNVICLPARWRYVASGKKIIQGYGHDFYFYVFKNYHGFIL